MFDLTEEEERELDEYLSSDEHLEYFNKKLWRGLRIPNSYKEDMPDCEWLQAGYMRECDWIADEEGFTYDPLDTEVTEFFFPHPGRGKGTHVETLPTNAMIDEEAIRHCDEEAIRRIEPILKKYMDNKNYNRAMRFIK